MRAIALTHDATEGNVQMGRERQYFDAKPFGWEPRPGCLTIDDREAILIGSTKSEAYNAALLPLT